MMDDGEWMTDDRAAADDNDDDVKEDAGEVYGKINDEQT